MNATPRPRDARPLWTVPAAALTAALLLGITCVHAQAPADSDTLSLAAATDQAKTYGIRVFWTIVVILITHQIIKGTVWLSERLAERHAGRRLFYKRLAPIARLVLWSFAAVFIVRGIFNVDAQGVLAAAAAIGLAVGFATQGILKNIVGGFVIIADRPFQVGDKISVCGTYGEVISIGLRSTRIQTPDDNLVSVPNSQVVENQVANANAGQLDCQVVTDLYLPGWADEARARQIAYETAAGSKYVYLRKPIVVIVKDEFNWSHVLHLRVKAYVLDARFEFLLASDITERARQAFRAAGLLPGAPTAATPEAAQAPTPGPQRQAGRRAAS